MDTSKQKPDLMSSNRAAADSGKRILANLEHGPRPAAKAPRASGWTIDGWTIGLGLLLATMCTVAWLMHEKTITPGPFAHGSRSSATSSATSSAEVERRRAEPEAGAAVQTVQPATIVNEVAARPQTETQAAASANAAAAVPPAAAAQPAPHLAFRLATASAPASTATSTPHRPANASGVAAAAPAGTRPATARAAAPATAASDTDVALLTALVAHTARPAAVLPERSRDVVERQEGDSTAQLLVRCKQLGLIEGMLCRSRICSGRWDADPACNAPAH